MMSRLTIAGTLGLGAAIHLQDRSRSFLSSSLQTGERDGFDVHAEVSAELRETLQAFVSDLLEPNQVDGMATVHQGIKAISGKMDVRSAVKTINHQNLPDDVRSLVTTIAQSGSKTRFSEESMAKARTALNDLVEKAWVELDDKIIECKEYQEMNRGTFDQIVTDISRLVEQITDLERVETESLEGIAKMEMSIKDVEAELSKETKIYNYNYAKNSEELTRRQNDLDVFQFILTFTRCEDATSLLQSKLNETRICAIKGGGHSMCFRDHATQGRFNQMMSKSSKHTISTILAEVEGHKLPNFLQLSQNQEPTATTTANPALAAAMANPPEEVAGGDKPLPKGFIPAPFCCEAYGVACGPSGGGIMCSPDPPDCGLLHDKLSLMWGDYKDKVDELTMEMNKNAFMFEELKMELNDQIQILTNSKARFSMMLSEARSNLAADREEVKAKEMQKQNVDKQYIAFMKKCCERVKWIMFQDMCALIVVRNAALEDSSDCPGEEIVDCEVDNWVGKKCTVNCDDSCPAVPDPTEVYECGGWQEIQRKVVVQPPDVCGLRCPALSRTKKCNQIKCPVDCMMSEWSGWSKCTADCEGGVRSHTRSLLVKPKNGGMACNTGEETEACNTMSCDRDCTLARWTDWTPCSVACGGGMQSRAKHVLIPTRGFGKCPKEEGPKRFQEQECNTQDCVGDEVCIAVQDLVIAVDGSGSVREGGFNTLRNFALDLLSKYKSQYFGSEAMKVGLIEFGNGIIMEDGVTVSPAMNVNPITADLAAIKSGLEGMVQKKGFTNMAQAFALAETMYTSSGRKGAQSALLVITDGKPSFLFQTNELVEQLDDKGVSRFFVVVTEDKKAVDVMKNWASAPWETNLLHVPGISPLEADLSVWSQKALTLFCPMSMSPQLLDVKESSGGFMHVKDGGFCGARGELLSTEIGDAAGCAFLAQGAGAQTFLLGIWFRRGYCYAGTFEVTADQYNEWEQERVNPECPEGDRDSNNGFTNSMIFDFYAIEPAEEEEGRR
jgi:hypothetical protein